MIEVVRYNETLKDSWDVFISKSRIDSFIFYRDFMDYHSDRFTDFSLLVYRKGKLDAVLPGNINNQVFYSHQGLTYGGLILSISSTSVDILSYFIEINVFLKKNNLSEVIYKVVPFIYNKFPSQEDIYALYKLKAIKIGCNLSSTIYEKSKIPFVESRKSGLRKAKKHNVSILESSNLVDFWNILEDNLLRTHGTKPVHSVEEITLLQNKFPKNIINYNCQIESRIVAGCLLFIMENIVHVQYISANEEGKALGALDLLFYQLINEVFHDYYYFDFGQSTEKMGEVLNENLIFQKEGFGGRGVTYDIYHYTL